MPHDIKIRRIGGSLGAIFPKELLDEMHIGEGEELTVLREGSGIRLVPKDPDLDSALEAFDEVRRQYRAVFAKLAK
jgi:putative addiction module antidote